MLPTHVFVDVVAWLHFYDLDALTLTDTRCSDLACAAASKIRVFDFSEFLFDLQNTEIAVQKLTLPAHGTTVLTFHRETDLVEFVPAAMRNCVLGDLELAFKDSSDAIREVANTIIIEGTLFLDASLFANAIALVEFA
ncbi:hypothetical protein AAVH_22702, partial [Aphelenchoides avenae]